MILLEIKQGHSQVVSASEAVPTVALRSYRGPSAYSTEAKSSVVKGAVSERAESIDSGKSMSQPARNPTPQYPVQHHPSDLAANDQFETPSITAPHMPAVSWIYLVKPQVMRPKSHVRHLRIPSMPINVVITPEQVHSMSASLREEGCRFLVRHDDVFDRLLPALQRLEVVVEVGREKKLYGPKR